MPAKIVTPATRATSKPAAKPPTRHAAPAAPVRSAAPARPAAPVRPVAPQAPPVAAPVAAPPGLVMKRGPGRPSNAELAARVAAPVAPRVASDPALLASIETLKATIVTQNEMIQTLQAKSTANTRTLSQILDNAENGLAADDWRLSYQGAEILIYPYAEEGRGSNKQFVVHNDQPPMRARLAIPRSNDIGGNGSRQRSMGGLALHLALVEDTEEETYEGAPEYVSRDELAQIWASE